MKLRGAAAPSHAKQKQGTGPGVRTGMRDQRHTPGERHSTHCTRGWVDVGRKISSHQAVQPVASRYNTYGVNATQIFVSSPQQDTMNSNGSMTAKWRVHLIGRTRHDSIVLRRGLKKTVFWDIHQRILF